MRKSKIIVCGCLLAGSLALAACDTSPIDAPKPVTEILDVRVVPNPVAKGDTATFTVVIKDSLDPDFEFSWIAPGRDYDTDDSVLHWPVTLAPGTYQFAVLVNNPNTPLSNPAAVSRLFEVTVTE